MYADLDDEVLVARALSFAYANAFIANPKITYEIISINSHKAKQIAIDYLLLYDGLTLISDNKHETQNDF